MDGIPIEVRNITNATGIRPVTGGVPIAEGEAPRGTRFELADGDGRAVPLQAQVIAVWKDGSARWLLVDFQSDPKPGDSKRYTLSWGAQRPAVGHEAPVRIATADTALLRSGNVEVVPSKNFLVEISGRLGVAFRAVDGEGREYRAVAESVKVQTKGDLRSTLDIAGSFRDGAGRRWFGFRAWVTVYAGLSKVLIEPLVVMDAEKGLIQRIRELTLDIVPKEGVRSAAMGGDDAPHHVILSEAKDLRLFQVDDQSYWIEKQVLRRAQEGVSAEGGKAPGWAEIDDGKGSVALALRDSWRRWPKSLQVDADKLRIGLLPRFKKGAFDHMGPWYKYEYLFEGDCYRLRTGQARRWQVWIDLDGDGPNLAEHANAPLIPAADPAYAVSTGVWGLIAPAGAPGQASYDVWAAKAFESYVDAVDQSRDYGEMNWGDWHGERKCNWANNEYDTARQMLVEHARTGDPGYFHRAFVTARHTSEVDTIHHVNEDLVRYFLEDVCRLYTNRGIIDNYPIRPGMVHCHCVGHVGGFHPVEAIDALYREFQHQPEGYIYPCLDPYNISHLFTQGMAYCWFLTGDPWIRETLMKIGDNLAKLVEDRKFPFAGRACEGREFGWPMLALLAIYEMDWDPRYLNAVKILADEVLSLQDAVHGGWLRRPGYGTCGCEPEKHEGEGTFLSAIRINALCRYYRLSGDERVLGPVRVEVDHLIEDRWDEHTSDWRYYACPKSSHHIHAGVLMMAMANAVDLFDDPEHRRVLKKAWDKVCEHPNLGKGYGPHAYGAAETSRVLA